MSQPARTSIFARRMMKKRREGEEEEEEGQRRTAANMELDTGGENVFGDRSYIVEGADAERIHGENVEKLSSMSREELELERRRLISVIDPATVAFLESRRKAKSSDTRPSPTPMEATSGEDTAERRRTPPIGEIAVVKELVNRYPNMDTVEAEKLRWIGEMKKPDPPDPNKPYNARFNFEGTLLGYADDGEGLLKGLQNHGEEEARPGYTVQELMQLSRSTVLRQRVVALQTLSNIIANAHRYEDCFEEPILRRLYEDADMFLLFRFSLDDSASPVVMAAVRAMSSLIVNSVDETCLDVMLGTPLGIQQPSLGIVLDMTRSDIEELKDDQLFKLDAIRGAVRTQLLHRIRYIIDEMNPEPVEIKCMLKCATRIARHSYEIAEEIFNCPGLIRSVCSLLNRRCASSHFPEALKLLRVLMSRSYSMADAIVGNYPLMDSIFRVIAGETKPGHPELMHLTLESFYTWQSVLSYNIATDTISSLTPVVVRLLEAHYGVTSVGASSGSDLEHAAAIMSVVNTAARVDFSSVSHVVPLAVRLSVKWTTQISASQQFQLADAKLVGACLHLMATVQEKIETNNELVAVVEKLLRSNCFSCAAQRLRKFSWLLSGEVRPHPDNLPHLGSIPATLRPDSTLPLIHGLTSYLLAAANPVLGRLFIFNTDILAYIEDLFTSENVRKLSTHWYARQELTFLAGIVHVYIRIKVTGGEDGVYHNLAYMLLTAVQSGDKYLLPDIFSKLIFSPLFFRNSIETIAEKMKYLTTDESSIAPEDWEQRRKLVDAALHDLESIGAVYRREFGIDSITAVWPPLTLTGLLNSSQPAFPTDWPYAPIIRLYNYHGNCKGSREVATRCLQFILLLEESGIMVDGTSATAKYCRLSCLYLAGNDLFREVTPLLEAILHNLLKYSDRLDFEKPVAGLTSFYDFYRQMLEEYAGVSYCDAVFGEYVLVPVQQRHSSKYKKLLWSEMGTVLRLLSTPVSKVDMKQYLEPCETDADILMSYLYSLATGRIQEAWSPIMYRMAVHHIATYIGNARDDDKVGKALLNRINKLGNKELQNLLLNYKAVA